MKKTLTAICCMILLVTNIICSAEPLRYGDFEYELADDGTAILGLYKGTANADVVLPLELDGHAIMGCSDNPFWETPISSISVPEDHPYFLLVDGTLYGKLDHKLIYYPPNAEAKEVVLPQGIITFGPHCFYGCTNILGIIFAAPEQ